MILAAVLPGIGYAVTPDLLALIGAPVGTPVHDMATTYTRTIFLGVYFMFGFFVFQALLRGWGDTKTPMYLMVGSAR